MIQSYHRIISKAARDLTAEIIFPVDVVALCARLSTTIERSKESKSKALILGSDRSAKIQLPESQVGSKGFTPHDRFVVAHELGHLILYRECNATPLGKSEYWQHEEACDLFARLVLLPDKVMNDLAENGTWKAAQWLRISRVLARRAVVTWETAAHRLSDLHPSVVFLKIETPSRLTPGSRFRVVFSTLPNNKGRGALFGAKQKLGKTLAGIGPESLPTAVDPSLCGDLEFLPKINEGAVIRHNGSAVRMALICDAHGSCPSLPEAEGHSSTATDVSIGKVSTRQTLFISHGNPEDNEFTRWLGAKLTLAGYRVWYDLERLRGGDVFWDKVERAIREETFRLIAVISRASHDKEGIRKEWNLASIVEKTTPGFVIPIRIDDFKFDDVTILFSGKNIIDFHRNWFEGLTKLLETLQDVKTPRASVPDPAQASLWWKSGIVTPIELTRQEERLESSWLPFRLPLAVETVTSSGQIGPTAENQRVPWYQHERSIVSFARRDFLVDFFKNQIKLYRDRQISTDGLLSGSVFLSENATSNDARNVLSFLVSRTWDLAMEKSHLRKTYLAGGHTVWFVPKGLTHRDVFEFYDETKHKRRRQLVGRSEKYKVNWHYGVSAKPILGKPSRIELTPHIVFTEDSDDLVDPPSRAHRLRRGFCRNWWNARWRDFQRAFLAYLSQGDDCMHLAVGGDRYVEVWATPFIYSSPVSLSDNSNQASEQEIMIDQEVENFDAIDETEVNNEENREMEGL